METFEEARRNAGRSARLIGSPRRVADIDNRTIRLREIGTFWAQESCGDWVKVGNGENIPDDYHGDDYDVHDIGGNLIAFRVMPGAESTLVYMLTTDGEVVGASVQIECQYPEGN